jgi:hypothetical protein
MATAAAALAGAAVLVLGGGMLAGTSRSCPRQPSEPIGDVILHPVVRPHFVCLQHPEGQLKSLAQGSAGAAIRLVSLDYGKTIRWSGRGPVPERARQWLATLRAARDTAPGRLARVYNVPVVPSIYRLLLDAGVDLIGTKRLAASAEVLRSMKAPSLP